MTSSSSTWTLTARWVFPVDRPPLERGIVTIAGDRIAAVESHGARTADVDFGNAAVLPGLVNAHTHLDLSGLRGKCPPSPDFTGWLRQVIAHRRATTPEQIQADVRAGLAESLRSGTTLLGDISGDGTSWEALIDANSRCVVFREMLGLTPRRAIEVWKDVSAWSKTIKPSSTCRPGLSPHAPYSVHRGLIRSAISTGLPMTIHLAETRAELDLLERRDGPFVSFLKELGVWAPEGLVRRTERILWWARRASLALFAHGNYLPADARIPSNGTIVYCPRTHAAFGHPPHPFRAFLARGVRAAFGTDSLASNPDLSLLEEARFLHQRHPDVPGDVLLRMATLSGAEALGWHDETGSLTPGKSADLVVVPLPPGDAADPHHLLLQPGPPVRAVLFRGTWGAGAPTP